MKLSDFDYNLPKELIATHPVEPRDAAKLLLVENKSSELLDYTFKDLPNILQPGDVLVFNNSKVIPARLQGKNDEGRKFEVFLIKKHEGNTWECWVKPGKKAKLGKEITFSDKLSAQLIKREEEIFYFEFNLSDSDFFEEIEKIGEVPVPPYILKAREEAHSEEVDKEDYQTVYATKPGSVAAPTAGLHFTDDLLFKLREKGILIEYVTLHVGLGTFQPVTTENIEDYEIHSEYFEIDADTAERLTKAKARGGRVIAVGTTSVRVLESAAVEIKSCGFISGCNMKYGLLPRSAETKIYIYPGYNFKFIDGMITNFHLPKSSLILLVSALAGKEKILSVYDYAVANKYRFYSYGDGMLIL